MKRVFILSLLFISATVANGQFLKNVKDKVSGGGTSTTTEFKSLGEIANQWADGSYSKRRQNNGMWEPMGKKEIKFIKDENGDVVKIDIDGEKYGINRSTGAPFVKSFGGNHMLYLTETTIIMYYKASSGIYPSECYGAKKGIGASKKEIIAFRDFADAKIEEQKAQYSKEQGELAEKKAAERKAKYGLEGKDVAKIEIINLSVPEKFGHYTGFSFDLKATLKDGTEITTENGTGYMSDYEISYDESTYNYGKLEKGFLDDDQITITAKCKSNPSLTTSETVVMKYNQDITNKWNGTSWSRGRGENAYNFKIEVKATKHKVTNADLLMIRITNVSTGELTDEYKIAADQTVHFFCSGGNGGTDDGRGNDGGNGGNLTVIKDPNVKYFNLDYKNYAGRGGKGSHPSYDGRDGRDGVFREEVRAVNF